MLKFFFKFRALCKRFTVLLSFSCFWQISFFAGIFLNEGVNLVLKYIVREPRPTSPHTVSNLEYGWPSSHSQFTWFFVTYIIFFIYFRYLAFSFYNDFEFYAVTYSLLHSQCYSIVRGCSTNVIPCFVFNLNTRYFRNMLSWQNHIHLPDNPKVV